MQVKNDRCVHCGIEDFQKKFAIVVWVQFKSKSLFGRNLDFFFPNYSSKTFNYCHYQVNETQEELGGAGRILNRLFRRNVAQRAIVMAMLVAGGVIILLTLIACVATPPVMTTAAPSAKTTTTTITTPPLTTVTSTVSTTFFRTVKDIHTTHE